MKKMHNYRLLSLFTLCLLLSIGCNKDNEDKLFKPAIELSTKTESYDADLVRDWMVVAYDAVKERGFFALDASRLYAYTSITLYESMVHGIENGRSLNGQLQGLNNLPKPDENKQYDWSIVMCHAAPLVITHMLNDPEFALRQKVKQFELDQEKEIIAKFQPSQQVIIDSKNFGLALANAIIKYADADNTAAAKLVPYAMPGLENNPQYFDGNGTSNFFMLPFWWTARPLAINTYNICQPEGPYDYSEDPASAYYKDVEEVYEATLDPEKVSIGQFWANNPSVSGTPAGSWVGIANQLVDQYKMDIVQTLRMYTLLTIGTRDAFIVVWYTKYRWNLQRPVSFIRKVMGYDNWLSPVPTPPYPDYVSGTSANAGSSATMLTRILGNRSFTDNQHADKGFQNRPFQSFHEAGVEAFHSRIYAGVHMRKACEDGFELGKCVAENIIGQIRFEK